jgi:hypothetical protein
LPDAVRQNPLTNAHPPRTIQHSGHRTMGFSLHETSRLTGEDKHVWHDDASDGLAPLWLGCLWSSPFRLFARSA